MTLIFSSHREFPNYRRFSLFSLVIAICLSLGACGGSTSSTPAGNEEPGGGGVSEPGVSEPIGGTCNPCFGEVEIGSSGTPFETNSVWFTFNAPAVVNDVNYVPSIELAGEDKITWTFTVPTGIEDDIFKNEAIKKIELSFDVKEVFKVDGSLVRFELERYYQSKCSNI